MTRGVLLPLVASIFFATAPAYAEGWSDTFAGGLGPLDPGGPAMIVTPTDSAEETALADAVREALRPEGSTRVMLGDEALGVIGELSDAQIVELAASYPVAVTVIVRSSGEDAGLLWVHSSEHSRALLVRKGVALEQESAPAHTQTATAGVPTDEVEQAGRSARAHATTTSVRANGAAKNAAARRAEIARRLLVVKPEDGFGEAFEGGVAISFGELYGTLDADLERKWRRRSGWRTGLLVGGAAVAAGGVGALFVDLTRAATCSSELCANRAIGIAGGGALLVGAASIVVGLLTRPHPLTRPELKARLTSHNDGLAADAAETAGSP